MILLTGGVENMRDNSLLDAFFFSVQTMATIGYGDMVPVTAFGKIFGGFTMLLGIAMLVVLGALLVMREQIPRLTARAANEVAAAAPVPHGSPVKP